MLSAGCCKDSEIIQNFETWTISRKTRARSITYTEQYNEIGPKYSSSPVYTDYGSFSNPTAGTWILRSQRYIPLDMEEIRKLYLTIWKEKMPETEKATLRAMLSQLTCLQRNWPPPLTWTWTSDKTCLKVGETFCLYRRWQTDLWLSL